MSALTDALDALAPGQQYYKIYTAVNSGFITSTQAKTNQVCTRIQIDVVVDHYKIRLSNTGNEPATHFGSAGLMEKPEAFEMIDWYDVQNPASIDVWFLTKNNEILWKNIGGLQVSPFVVAPNYVNDFLPSITPPGLEPIVPPL